MSVDDSDTKPVIRVHPDYNFDDADLVLLSSDNVHFHVHSVILKLSSSTFRDMLAVKRVHGDGPVQLAETEATIRILLDMIYPRRPPSTISFSDFNAVAVAAEKYDMTYVNEVLEEILLGKSPSTTVLFDEDQSKPYAAIRAYLMASRLGWTAAATELSAETLSCDLNTEVAQDLLFAEDAPRIAARELLSLHQKRRIWAYNAVLLLVGRDKSTKGSERQRELCKSHFKSILPHPPQLQDMHFDQCSSRLLLYYWTVSKPWWEFKNKVFDMLEVDGSCAQFFTDEFYSSKELRDLLKRPCCDKDLHENESIIRKHFFFVFENIPKTLAGFRALEKTS